MSSFAASAGPRPSAPSAPPSAIWKPDSIVQRAVLEELFSVSQPFEVEVGSGDGGFLIPYAKAHPERNFLAIERLLGRLRKIDRKARRAGLANLRALRLEASYSVDYLLPRASVSAMHIYFPDPWPKRRHRHRRLIEPAFVGAVCRALQPGGRLYLRTDDADYASQMRRVCESAPSLRACETPDALTAFVTDFERHFLAAGVATNRLAYERV